MYQRDLLVPRQLSPSFSKRVLTLICQINEIKFPLQKIIEMQLHIHYNKDEVETEYISAKFI